MDDSKKIVLGIMLISIFVLVVAVSSLYVQTEISSGNACGCFIPIPIFIPFIASIGLFIGTLIYYMFSPRFENKKIDKNVLLDFVEGDERKVLKKLIDNKELGQAEIVRETGLAKVKVSRIIKKFEERGIIEKNRIGKINNIKLRKEILDII